MQSVGPVTLALNTLTTQSDPAQKVGTQSVAVQVQNASIFVLSIIAEGNQYTLQPYTAQTIPVSSQPITVLPTSAPGGGTTPALCWFIWLLHGEAPPQQDGQLTAQAIAAAIAGSVSLSTGLEVNSHPAAAGGGSFSFVSTKTYLSLAILVSVPLSIGLSNTTTGFGAVGQIVSTVGYFLCPVNAGDTVTISWSSYAGGGTISVVGLNSAPVYQAAGSPIDVVEYGGLSVATGTFTDGLAHTIVAAPGTGRAVRLHNFGYFNTTAITSAALNGNPSAATYFVRGYASVVASDTFNLGGQLVTEALQVQMAGATGTYRYTLSYDTVNSPVIA